MLVMFDVCYIDDVSFFVFVFVFDDASLFVRHVLAIDQVAI